MIIPISKIDEFINQWDKVHFSLKKSLRIGLVKQQVNTDFEGYAEILDYWPKYKRFLVNNNIPFSLYDIKASSWQKEAENFDVVIWAIPHNLTTIAEAKLKFYFLEKYMNIKCFPTYNDLWGYEDKICTTYLFEHFKLPYVKTFISNLKNDALKYLNNSSYPIISKITNGSGSNGIVKLNTKRSARKYLNSVFSEKGRITHHQAIRQKDYIYFQQYIEDAKYDLRIIVVGNKLFGYYRYPKKGDFRASGSHIIKMNPLPEEAMKIAIDTKKLFGSTILAVDMLYSEKEQKYFIIETSIIVQVDDGLELVLDGKPGYYEYSNNEFTFKEGKYWIQELALQEFFNSLN